jgi:mannosyltransferase
MSTDTRPEVIVTCMKKRLSGVTSTISALLPVQAPLLKLGYVGAKIPGLEEAQHASHSFQKMSLWAAIWSSRKRLADGRKIVWHVRRDHEMLLGILLRDVLRLPIHLCFTSSASRQHSWFPSWLISRMELVIANVDGAAAFVPNTSRVVLLGVDTYRFSPPTDKLKAWQDSGLPGRYGIGIFGRVRHQKGIHIFVQALLQVLPLYPDFTAVVCGLCKPEDEGYRAQLQKQLAQADLQDRVVWLGMVPVNEVPLWYQRVSITVACPLNEGYGLTVIEGMACGSAAVASRTGGFAEMISEGETGHLVPTDDAPALAEALDKIMQDTALMQRMGERSRKRVEQVFSVQAEAAKIQEVYQLAWQKDLAK